METVTVGASATSGWFESVTAMIPAALPDANGPSQRQPHVKGGGAFGEGRVGEQRSESPTTIADDVGGCLE